MIEISDGEPEPTTVRVILSIYDGSGHLGTPLVDFTNEFKSGDAIRQTFPLAGVTYAIDVIVPKTDPKEPVAPGYYECTQCGFRFIKYRRNGTGALWARNVWAGNEIGLENLYNWTEMNEFYADCVRNLVRLETRK